MIAIIVEHLELTLTYNISSQLWAGGGSDLITLNLKMGKLRTESFSDFPGTPARKS